VAGLKWVKRLIDGVLVEDFAKRTSNSLGEDAQIDAGSRRRC